MKEHASFNRCYRLLWSGTTEQWKPVPETARTAKKGGRGKAANTLTLAGVLPGVAMSLFVMSNLAAQPPPQPPAPAATQLPTGGSVVAGQATISQSAIATAANMVVNQNSQRAIIDWSSFNLGSAATVQFVQPNAQSVILNRVLDPNPSQIFGRINANGQVFLTNPYGVYFSPSATVDVGGLVATTYDIRNADFMSGYYRFERTGGTGRVVNEGTLRANAGGYIALLAPEVQNSGVVLARAGTVAMAAGDEVTLTLADGKSLSGITTTASSIASLVENKLAVLAPDGQIILSAVALNKLQAGVIKNSGSLEATSLTAKGGKIVLEADEIELTANATIDVSGRTGGGTVLMGGDWQGSGTVRHATQVTMAANSTISANATDSGDGGKVVLWSNVSDANSTTTAAGSIFANAGPNGGNGGQIETSGYHLNVDGIQVSTQAPKGNMGEWLLDPANITIVNGLSVNATESAGVFTPNASANTSNISNVSLSNALANTSVTVSTTNSGAAGSGAGDINIGANISWSSASVLTLNANNNILGNGNISMPGGGSVVFNTSNASTDVNNVSYSGIISGNGSVTKQGLGAFSMGASSTYTGNTTVSAGVLYVKTGGNSTTTLDGSGNLTFASSALGTGVVKVQDGATLKLNSNVKMANYLELQGVGANGQSGALALMTGSVVYGKTMLKASGTVIGGSGGVNNESLVVGDILDGGLGLGLTLNSTGGIASLQGSKSYSGTTLVNGVSNLWLIDSGTNATFNSTFNISSGSQLRVGGIPMNAGVAITIAGDVIGAGDLNLSYAVNSNMPTVKLMGQLLLTGTTSLTNTTLMLNNNHDYTVTSNLTGSSGWVGKLQQSGSGNVTIAGNGSGFTGKLVIDPGASLTIGDGGTNGSLNISNVFAVVNNGNLSFNRSDNVTFNAPITGSGALNKFGSNVLTLAGNSTFTGNITVNAGTLKAGVGGLAGYGAFGNLTNITLTDVAGVGLNISGFGNSIASLTGGVNTTVDLGTAMLTTGLNNASTTFAGTVLGSGVLNKSGTGSLTLSGNSSTFTGSFTVTNGSLVIPRSAVLGNGKINITGNTSTLELQNVSSLSNPINLSANATLLLNSDTTLTGNLTIANGTSSLNVPSGNTLNIAGNVSVSNATLKKDTPGNLLFSEPTAPNSTQSVNAINITTGNVEVNSSKFSLSNNNTTRSMIGSGSTMKFDVITGGAFYMTNNGLLQIAPSTNSTFGGVISGTGNVDIMGSGTATFSNQGNYTGTTTIRENSSAKVMTSGSTLNSFGAANSTLTNNGTLYLTASGNNDWGQSIGGSGNVVLSNYNATATYTIGFNQVNSYTGTTTINDTLKIYLGGISTKSGLATFGTGDVLLNGSTAQLWVSADNTIANNIKGTGNVQVYNPNLTATFTGNVNVSGLVINGYSTLKIGPTGTLGSAGTFAGNIVVAGTNGTFEYAGASDLTLTGNLTDQSASRGVLRKSTSNSNLILTGSNVLGGDTFIETGAVYAIGSNLTTGRFGGTGTVYNNATLVINHTDTTSLNLSNLVGNITGTGNFTFINVGNITIDKTINLSGANSTVLMQSNGNVTVNSTITSSGANGKISLVAGAATAAGTATGGQIAINSTANLTLCSTGTVVMFQGNNSVNLTATLDARVIGANTTGVAKYKTYNASVNSIISAVSGTRNYFYRLRPNVTLSGGTIIATKVYDGTNIASPIYTPSGGNVSGVDGDLLTGCVTGATYNSSNAGTNKTLNLTLSIVSANASWVVSGYNGTINTTSTTTTANITKANLTVKANDDARFVTFSDTEGYKGASYSGFVNGETLATSGVTGTLNITRSNSSNAAGPYNLTVGGLTANNYHITFVNGTYTIVPAQQLIVSVSDGTSAYGNTPNLTVASASYLMPDNRTIVDLTGNLSLSNGTYTLQDGASGAASFKLGLVNPTLSGANQVAAGIWNVGYSNLTQTGVNFNNMTVVGTQTVTRRTVNVTATATNKEYNGNTNASVVLANNLLAGDVVNFASDSTGVFASKNAGNGINVTVSNITVTGGADAGNYILNNNVATTTANITPKALTLFGLTATDKVYDATTTANVAFTGFSGLVGADDVQVGSTGTFSDKNVGNFKTVTVPSSALSGADAGNYQFTSATTTASITAKAITVSGLSAVTTKVYDGTTTASPLGTASLLAAEAPGTGASNDGKVFSGDVVSITGTPTATYNSKDVATAVNVTFGGISLTGAQAGNYVLTTPSPIAANITKAPLLIQANDDARFVVTTENTSYAGVSYKGLVPSENATTAGLTGTLNITRSNAGSGLAGNYTLTPSGLSAGNYDVSFANGTYTIVPAETLLIRVANSSTVYGTTATMNVTDISYLMSDNVTIVNLTSNLTVTSGLYTVQDGASGSASFNLGLVNTTSSASGRTAVGIWNVGYSNLTQTSANFNNVTAVGTQTVTAKAITVGATAANKTYDGNTTATMTLSSADAISGDNISYAYSNASFVNKNVETNKIATATNITLGGADAGNYAIQNLVATATANITAKTLTITGITAANKAYDGCTTATTNVAGVSNAVLLAGGMVSGDNVTVAATGSFVDKSVGTAKVVNLTSTYSGSDAGNYNIVSQVNTTANITAKTLTISGITAADRVYDGGITATISTAGVTNAVLLAGGLVSGDTVTVAATGTFADKHVGTAKVVNLTSSYGGADMGNYDIVSQANTTANITAKALTISGITAANKEYNGCTTATVSTAGVNSTSMVAMGLVAGDTVTLSTTGAFASKNVGNSTVVMLTSTYGGADAGNYNIASQTFTQADITPKALTISGITANNKVYDGCITATANVAGVTNAVLVAGGLVSGDNVTVAATGSFADKSVGTSKVVNLTSTYSGTDASNYNITSQVNTTANITAKGLTISGITAADKVYDGCISATINTAGVTNAVLVAGGLVSGDNVTVSATGTFADKNANTSKVVTLSSSYGGADLSNYNITSQASTTANITAKAVTLTAPQVTRAYDGTLTYTTAAADLTALTSQLGVASDSVTGITLAFLDKNVGTNKTVTAAGATISDGNLGGNYNLSYANSSVSSITAKAITVTGLTADNKVYDATTTATINTSGVTNATLVTAGMIAGDALTVSATGTFADKNVGNAKVVTLNATYGGADAGNYNITSQVNTTANITPKSLTVAGLSFASSKVYDGTTDAAPLTMGALQSESAAGAGTNADGKPYTGDTVSLAGTPTGTYNNKNVATAANISVSGLSLAGADANNYVLTAPSPIAATITPAALVVRANDDARFVTLNDTAGYAGVSYSGFVNNETSGTAGLGGVLSIVRSNNTSGAAGNYTLTPSGLTASNYNLSYQTGTYTIVPAQTLLIRVNSTSSLYGNAVSLNVTSASYLMSDNVTIVNLTGNLSAGGNGLYSVQDGASGSANFTVGLSNVTLSGSGHVPVGIWNVGTSNLTQSGANFNTLMAVGTQTVTAKTINVSATAANKVYDGNTNATVTLNSSDVLTGDNVSYAYSSATFASKTAETNKSVSIANISLAGGDAHNYQVHNLMANATADITPGNSGGGGGGGGGQSGGSDDSMTSQRALAVTLQTAQRMGPTRISTPAAEVAQPPAPARAATSGVLPVAVIEDNRMSNLGMTFEQQPNDIHIQLTTAPAVLPPPPTMLRFSGNFKTFMVMNDRGEMVSYQGAMVGKRMVILADTDSAKRLARVDMQTVLAAAITTLGSDQPITLSEIESVVMDLR